jgi:predicted nucleic acid-binding protein
MRFLSQLAAGQLDLIRVMDSDEDRALAILAQYDDKAFSMTDAVSFAVMERLGIQHVFAYDRDFERYGASRGWQWLT